MPRHLLHTLCDLLARRMLVVGKAHRPVEERADCREHLALLVCRGLELRFVVEQGVAVVLGCGALPGVHLGCVGVSCHGRLDDVCRVHQSAVCAYDGGRIDVTFEQYECDHGYSDKNPQANYG